MDDLGWREGKTLSSSQCYRSCYYPAKRVLLGTLAPSNTATVQKQLFGKDDAIPTLHILRTNKGIEGFREAVKQQNPIVNP